MVKHLCRNGDVLTVQDVHELLAHGDMKALLVSMQISLDMNAACLFEVVSGSEQKTSMTSGALFAGLWRLRGSRDRPHSLCLHRKLGHCFHQQACCLDAAEVNIEEHLFKHLEHVEKQVCNELATFQVPCTPSRQIGSRAWELESVKVLDTFCADFDGLNAGLRLVLDAPKLADTTVQCAQQTGSCMGLSPRVSSERVRL